MRNARACGTSTRGSPPRKTRYLKVVGRKVIAKLEDMSLRALRIMEAHDCEDHHQVAITRANLLHAHRVLGSPATKKDMLQHALKRNEAQIGDLANAHCALGAPKTKKDVLQRTLSIRC